MRDWSPERVAAAAGARVAVAPRGDGGRGGGPTRVVIDSREAGPGDLFVGLRGERVDGGRFAAAALAAGAWGALVGEEHAGAAGEGVGAEGAAAGAAGADSGAAGAAAGAAGEGVGAAGADRGAAGAAAGALLVADDPLAALGRLANAWRHALGARVVGVTGSTGKTSTKDVLAAMVAPQRRVVATAQNLNTEIGLPLTVLGAPAGTEVLVLEMAMRGAGQIAQLAQIAQPDVGVIVNVGPVHLELLGSVEAVAAAKAELVAGLRPGATAVLPAGEPLLAGHLRDDLQTVTFGPGGDVAELPPALVLPFSSAHMRSNALAALAAARAVGVEPAGELNVALSAMRGQRIELRDGVVVVNDCYNANPMSMRAAIDDLAASAPARRVAVLGDMLELGPDERRFHGEVGEHARRAGVDLLVTVGPLAAEIGAAFGGETRHAPDAQAAAALLPGLLRPGDTVLVKASRGVGLEVVARALEAG